MTQYAVHSVVRAAAHRTHRAQLPAALRKKHYLGTEQVRLMPGRPLIITEDMLRRNLEDFRSKAALHILEVRMMDGRVVDLATLEPGPAAPTPLLPHPKLDSVADDKQVGQYIPPYVGDDTAMPQVMPPGQKPSLLTDAAEQKAIDDTPDVPVPPSQAVDTDAELEEALAAAQADGEEGGEVEGSAPSAQEQVSSEGQPRKGRRNRR
jgi:hypothetical protein